MFFVKTEKLHFFNYLYRFGVFFVCVVSFGLFFRGGGVVETAIGQKIYVF